MAAKTLGTGVFFSSEGCVEGSGRGSTLGCGVSGQRYNDDTTVKILAMMDRQALAEDLVDEPVEDSAEDGSVEDFAEMAGDTAGIGTSPCRTGYSRSGSACG